MSWLNLNESLNSLKGQITSFASEVLSEVPEQDSGDIAVGAPSALKELEEKCRNQELEIASLKRHTEELQASLQSERLNGKNGVKEEESSWYWDPPPQTSNQVETETDQYRIQIKALQEELSFFKERDTVDIRQDTDEELNRLREENKNLTTNLEDLDSQHQLAMERLLGLKKELQKNFEVLRQEHEDLKNTNDEYGDEIKNLMAKISEKDKEIESKKSSKSDYDTLHQKYMSLERIHSLLRENAEKFQEENQELHEEIFKLQEQVTKLEHEVELVTKHSELADTVPRDRYDELLKELNDLKDNRNSNRVHLDEVNIDDNAKSVIENLKRDLNDMRHRLALKEISDSQADKVVKSEKIMQLYNKYVNFELPVDYLGEVPSTNDNIVVFKLESALKTLHSFKKDIDMLEHKVSEKNLNINHLQTQIDDLTTENDFLTNDIQHFERELEEMKKNNDFLISEIAALKNTSKLEPIIETHEDNLAKLETELADSNKINKTFESEIKRIEKELMAVQSEKSLLQASLTDLKEKYTLMLSELDMFKTQTKALEELENSAILDNEHKLKSYSDEIHELKKRLNATNAKNEQLSIDVHIIENDKVLLTQKIDDLKQKLSHKDVVQSSLEQKKNKNELNEKLTNKVNIQDNSTQVTQIQNTEKEDNNTTLFHEFERVNIEKVEALEKLAVSIHENSMLKANIVKLNSEVNKMKKHEETLLSEINDVKNQKHVETENTNLLKKTIEELNAKLIQQEMFGNEVAKLKEEKNNLVEKKQLLETELTSSEQKIVQLEEEFRKITTNLGKKGEESEGIIEALNSTITENNVKLTNLSNNIFELENNLANKSSEIANLQRSLTEANKKLDQSSQKSNESHEAIFAEKESLRSQLVELNVEVRNKSEQISTLENKIKELEKSDIHYKTLADDKDKEIKELRQSIVEISDKLKNKDNSNNGDDYAILQNEKETVLNQVSDLQNNLTAKKHELSELRTKCDQLEKTCVEYKTISENTTAEKTELINLVNLKHNESLQYHNEIQRLNNVLLEQSNEFKKVIEEKNQQYNTIHINDGCQQCDNLRTTLREKDEIIKVLNQSNSVFERQKSDLVNANESLRILTERCDGLETNLELQLETVKKLTAERIQLSEQHDNATRELERLRHHLVETEENYTQELMTSEQKLTECQARLVQVEERAKQSSTVYTSNSIRANQEVETYKNQIKLLEKQREEVQARLSDAEDARSRSEAALTNLQVVLEQFQLDKERDIHTATEKIRNKMEDLRKENSALQGEINRLNDKLQESLAGLQAATRLGDQLETKTAQINDLKEQVKTLQTSVGAAEERYYNAISNQQDKVDKNLVKNLVLNYVLTAGNSTNKTQVLRILSTVLDFNQPECAKLGLSKAQPTDSLAAEFVKFLQDESRPRAALPSMMGLTRSTTPSSRKSSTIGTSPNPSELTGHKRNPSTGSNNLLFQNIDNIETSSQLSIESDHRVGSSMDTGVNQTRNTEGAILKHVLKDM